MEIKDTLMKKLILNMCVCVCVCVVHRISGGSFFQCLSDGIVDLDKSFGNTPWERNEKQKEKAMKVGTHV